MSTYSDIAQAAYRRRQDAASQLLAKRSGFVELLGSDDPYLDGWLEEIAAEYISRRAIAAAAKNRKTMVAELLDDKRAIGRVLRFIETVNWTLPSDYDVMLRVLPALGQIADKRIKQIEATKKVHRQPGSGGKKDSSEKAVPQHTLAALAAVFKVITGTDPLADRRNTSSFCDFVRLFMEAIGERRHTPSDLWRNISTSLKHLRWLEDTAQVQGVDNTTMSVERAPGVSA